MPGSMVWYLSVYQNRTVKSCYSTHSPPILRVQVNGFRPFGETMDPHIFFTASLCDCWVVKLSDLLTFLRKKNVLEIVRQYFDRNLHDALKSLITNVLSRLTCLKDEVSLWMSQCTCCDVLTDYDYALVPVD